MKKSETEICSVKNCNRPYYGKNLCNTHYQRIKNNIPLDAPIRYNRKNGSCLERNEYGQKLCINCYEYLNEECFGKNPKTKDGKQPYCRKCISIRGRYRNYRITEKQFKNLMQQQDNKCAICLSDQPNGNNGWHIDHNHSCCPGFKTCGKCIRGVLCSYCNKALGQFQDSAENLKRAIIYLQKYNLEGTYRGPSQEAQES